MRNKRKNFQKWLWFLVIFIGIGIVVAVYGWKSWKKQEPANEIVTVTRVVDGDTIVILSNGKTYPVRLIGVDAPEIEPDECFGQESYRYVRSALENQKVTVAGDGSFDDKDKYGRLLRYVYLENGINFNLSLIEQGYAKEYYFMGINYQFREVFSRQEVSAKLQKSGLWGKCI